MNLILSDVEETIMIVDQADGALEGQAVNVRASSNPTFCQSSYPQIGRKKEDEYAVRPRGRRDTREFSNAPPFHTPDRSNHF